MVAYSSGFELTRRILMLKRGLIGLTPRWHWPPWIDRLLRREKHGLVVDPCLALTPFTVGFARGLHCSPSYRHAIVNDL